MLLAAGFLGGAVYLYTRVGEESSDEMVVETGLTRLAVSLWTTGAAPGVNMLDTDLVKTIEALHGKYRVMPELLIQPAEGKSGERVGTHVIHFLSGPRRVLSVVVNVDLAAGTADILSHTTTEDIAKGEELDPAEELLKNFGKRKPVAKPVGPPPEDAGLPGAPEALPAVPPVLPEKVSEEPRKGDE